MFFLYCSKSINYSLLPTLSPMCDLTSRALKCQTSVWKYLKRQLISLFFVSWHGLLASVLTRGWLPLCLASCTCQLLLSAFSRSCVEFEARSFSQIWVLLTTANSPAAVIPRSHLSAVVYFLWKLSYHDNCLILYWFLKQQKPTNYCSISKKMPGIKCWVAHIHQTCHRSIHFLIVLSRVIYFFSFDFQM